jgi:glycosyltransferase involved in cell wall biosynthesis
MGKIAYITAATPFGPQETFILTEMLALLETGADILIIPRDKAHDRLFHSKAAPLFEHAIGLPLIDVAILKAFLKYMLNSPIACLGIINSVCFGARNTKIALKNLAVLPKAFYVAALLSSENVSHIHAHWASTTATMAYITSRLTGVPWSFTAHRWDIAENNILKEKCRTASFVRVISEAGRLEIMHLVDDASLHDKIVMLHMGVDIPGEADAVLNGVLNGRQVLNVVCPANLLPVKGHTCLFEACALLKDKNISMKCLVAGDGPLEKELKDYARRRNLEGYVEFLGRLTQEELFALYRSGRTAAVILPSIHTADCQKEGIPVSLMEAMAHGIPVISTDTGAIPELIADGSGIMVRGNDPSSIASAIENLISDPVHSASVGRRGKEKIKMDFNVRSITGELLRLFAR